MSNAKVLMLIAAFVALTFGSFIWFIVTWDADKEQPVGQLTPAYIERATI
ncbi:hypothetical protein SAMN04488005_2074 [Yoonia tamlensis]|uniref:Uncharacterized protein n=1 Tax=Yoonia tamlensis TaxID=390270 RepID=A0A1I6GRY0_9RHOB|nr:hypothetical protein [Yoonia tamlensis]SFR44817.1 hypothetical protein SAMN04488005_2074 [Yoonia tamlensis]